MTDLTSEQLEMIGIGKDGKARKKVKRSSAWQEIDEQGNAKGFVEPLALEESPSNTKKKKLRKKSKKKRALASEIESQSILEESKHEQDRLSEAPPFDGLQKRGARLHS